MEGKKYDGEKARFDLLDPAFIHSMAEVMTYGVEKYTPNNWQNVKHFDARYTAALHRHLNAWQQGESFDQESGLYHLAQIAVNAMFLFWKERYATNDVPRCESDDPALHTVPGTVNKIGPQAHYEQAGDELRSTSIREDATFCRHCKAYIYSGARDTNFCTRKCEQEFFGSDNAA